MQGLKKIAKIESIKTLNYATFRTLILLHAILFLLVIIVASSIKINIQGVTLTKVFQFPYVWNTMAWFASWFNLLLGILAIVLVTNEFQFRTFRKQLIDGLSRSELLAGKVLAMLFVAAYTMILVFVMGLIFGILKTSDFSPKDLVNGLSYLPILYIQAFAYMLLAMLFAFLIRTSGTSIVIFLLYLFPIEPILRAFIPDNIVQYMPGKIISKLTPMPDFVGISLSDMIEFNLESSSELQNIDIISKTPSLFITAIIAVGYCFVFILVIKYLISRKNF
jgi:ABC-type transport system involved in multi-copper enzyme maturation permease subunit